MKDGDWSLNLEDPYYEANTAEAIQECMEAVRQTRQGHYVNIVTPGGCGHPSLWLIPQLQERFSDEAVSYRELRYIDQCSCGGHVTRVYR